MFNIGQKLFPISYDCYVPKSRLKIIFTSGTSVKNNGGTKLYNLWVKLLRENGYDAYIATVDGKYDKWLVHHQQVISYWQVRKFKRDGFKVKVVSSWLDSPLEKILDKNDQFYYFDAELHWTLKFRNKLNAFLRKNKIAGIATHSRYIQSWYMANYGFKPMLINEWSDGRVFYPLVSKRIKGRIGYMPESDEDEGIIDYLVQRNEKEKVIQDIIKIEGLEKVVSKKMQTVDIFVGLNKGKNNLWGEGCPRTQQEALHSGATLVAFDCLGNREYLIDGYTGFLVSKYDKEEVWKAVKKALTEVKLKESLRRNAGNFVKSVFSDGGKFELVSEFLGLKGNTKQELSLIFDKPFWLQEDEAPFLSRYARLAKETIVEIGCAFGGSSTLFLLNKNDNVKLYSIDPFIKDSMGGFRASLRTCRKSVSDALKRKKRKESLKDWELIKNYSYNVAKSWDKKIDLLFIDGSHLYKDVKKDFYDWSRFVGNEGLILIHDSRKELDDPRDKTFLKGWNGPTRLVDEIIDEGKYELVDDSYSISVLKKV